MVVIHTPQNGFNGIGISSLVMFEMQVSETDWSLMFLTLMIKNSIFKMISSFAEIGLFQLHIFLLMSETNENSTIKKVHFPATELYFLNIEF